MKKLLPLIILLFAASVYAQTDCPAIKKGSTGIVKISNINADLATDPTCRKVSYTGTIARLNYIDIIPNVVVGITIRMSRDRKETILFGDDSLFDCFSEADFGNWQNKLKKGAKVKVVAWVCEVDGNNELSMAEIEFLPVNKKKGLL